MSKDNSGSHDSFGTSKLTPKEAAEKMGEEAQEILMEYTENPNPETFLGYMKVQAKFKSLVTGEDYIEPVKHHDIPMSDIYMRHNQKSSMNFFVGVLSRFKRKCSWKFPTMQVGVDNASYYFGYHPEWYKYFPLNFVVYVLQHEAHHILQDHIPRCMKNYNAVRPVDDKKPTKREMETIKKLTTYTNIAADESVNSILNHNEGNHSLDLANSIRPSDYGHEELWSYEEYLNSWLLDPYTLFGKKSDGSGSTGMGSGHSSMKSAMGEGSGEEGSGDITDKAQRDFEDATGSNGHTWIADIESGKSNEPSEADKKKIADAQKEAAEKGIPVDELLAAKDLDGSKAPTAAELNDIADSLTKQGERVLIDTIKEMKERGADRGTIPGNYYEKYEELTKVNEIHWTELFQQYITDPADVKEDFRINKYNRNTSMLAGCNKFGFKEDDPKYNIWISIDTSYSMCKDDIMEGLAVVQSVLKSDSEINITICEFDTKIHRITPMDQDSELLKDVVGRGGTDFNCIFHHLKEKVSDDQRPDLHIIFTDGGAPPPAQEHRIPVQQMPLLWVLTSTESVDWFYDNYGAVIRTSNN